MQATTLTDDEIEAGVIRWEELCDEQEDGMAEIPNVDVYLGISPEIFEAWKRNHEPRIQIGVDVDTCEPQRVHVVLGVGHFDKRPLCGADTLWGYHVGKPADVTCPRCLQTLSAGRP